MSVNVPPTSMPIVKLMRRLIAGLYCSLPGAGEAP